MQPQLYHTFLLLGGSSFVAKVLLAIVPLCGVLGAALSALWTSSRKTYVATITVERSKWLEKLRSNLAAYSTALTAYALDARMRSDAAIQAGEKEVTYHRDDFVTRFREVESLSNSIIMQLNPHGEVDRNILFLLENCGVTLGPDLALLAKTNSLLIKHSQWLLKDEWEKVKWEAGGLSYRVIHWRDKGRRRKEYRRFCTTDGDVILQGTLAVVKSAAKRMGVDVGTEEDFRKLSDTLRVKPKRNWLSRKREELLVRRLQKRIQEAAETVTSG